MEMKKYIVAVAFALLCVFAGKPVEVQATTFEDVKVYEVSDLRNYDQVVGLSWKLDWSLITSQQIIRNIHFKWYSPYRVDAILFKKKEQH